jgi:hypothetical protein
MVNTNVDDEFMNGLLRSLATEYHWRNFPGVSVVGVLGAVTAPRTAVTEFRGAAVAP